MRNVEILQKYFWGVKQNHRWCNTCYKRHKRQDNKNSVVVAKNLVLKNPAVETHNIKTPKISEVKAVSNVINPTKP